jgi:hypothetical protein
MPCALIARLHREHSTMASIPKSEADREHDHWLDEIVSLPEGAHLRKCSVDTLKREGKRGNLKIIELSPNRRGITRREALKQI